ncbi:MAG: hypothetical protein JOY80_11140 [Candidatus Dormibacteraeota bacterium]|nr:hypothetical protein [Candidatus Dormibacteraeota bacterium]
MSRPTNTDVDTGPRCPECGGALRFSHVEYAGRGLETTVRRCTACGAVRRGAAQPKRRRDESSGRGRRKAPIDEGPPENPVLTDEAVRRLLG